MLRSSITAAGTLAFLLTSTSAFAQSPTFQGLSARVPPTPQIVTPPAPQALGSDTCTTPQLLTGVGPYSYDTTGATTGPEGQSTTNCIFANLIGIESDVWFEWVASATTTYELSTCGLAFNDTKIAVYTGTTTGVTCPGAAAVATSCNDDIFALATVGAGVYNRLTRVSWAATAGVHYLIQVGVKPATAQGPGQISIDPIISQPPFTRYDATIEILYRTVGPATDTLWMQAQGDATTGVRQVLAVKTAAGAAFALTQSGVLDGNPITLGVWEDPNDDGIPNDAVLLSTFTSVVSLANTDQLATYTLPTSVTVSGVFFVGASYSHGVNMGFPAPVDSRGCASRPGQSYLAGNAGPVDFTLAVNTFAPAAISTNDANAFLMEADTQSGSGGVGTVFCNGDGVTPHTACPCANNSATIDGTGCLSSLGVGGKLRAAGNPSIAADTLVLQGSQMPNSTCLYFQGTTQQNGGNGSVFGDGLRCAGGSVIRLGATTNVSGNSTYPFGAAQPISIKGQVTAPGVRTYQGWYRNAAAFCTTSTFNLTNGLQITWVP